MIKTLQKIDSNRIEIENKTNRNQLAIKHAIYRKNDNRQTKVRKMNIKVSDIEQTKKRQKNRNWSKGEEEAVWKDIRKSHKTY